ncbi:MAG TPA: lipoyl synthase [Phycisphaerae bacterium]|jgi:lipoic acid synthetase
MTRSHSLQVVTPAADSRPDYTQPGRKPPWLRVKLPAGPAYTELRHTIDSHRLHTVCESAKCPNMGECWARGTATVMILGNVCTRSCGFCNIATGRPPELDLDEPRRVADAVALMNLKHCVITSVNRDELGDGGAAIWAETIRRVREASPKTNIEVLIPDFCGDWDALQTVLDAKPDILNHNTETVPSQYKKVRPQAKYLRTLELLSRAKAAGFITKTGLMAGIGENDEELRQTFREIRQREVDILTIGQYLQPTREHLPIDRWVTPEQFAEYKRFCLEELKYPVVESGPLVRSSYHAEEQAELKYLQSKGVGH